MLQTVITFLAPLPLHYTVGSGFETMTIFTLPSEWRFGIYIFFRKTSTALCSSQCFHPFYPVRPIVSTEWAPAFSYLYTEGSSLPAMAFSTLPPQF